MKNNEKQFRKGRNGYGKARMTRQLMLGYIIAVVVYAGLLVAGIYIAWDALEGKIWYSTDPLWPLLTWLEDYVVVVGGITFFVGWAVITRAVFKRALNYLDEVVAASEHLAALPEDPLVLSPALKEVQDQLNEAREKALHNARAAKEAEQRKNDLIVYLAHDLKTPLTSVIGYLTLLRDEPNISMELRARYTGIALDKAERLEDLINEFFDITRFNLTAIELEKERINLSRMLEQITSEFLPVLQEKGLSWETDIQTDVEFVCDPDKMERVLDNLIRNAVNYSYDNTQIQCILRVMDEHIEIQISNRGKTISPDKLSRIFEQFFRLDSSRSSASGGAGLGLAISKEIVELHGGTIMAESQNESITFTVRFPGETV